MQFAAACVSIRVQQGASLTAHLLRATLPVATPDTCYDTVRRRARSLLYRSHFSYIVPPPPAFCLAESTDDQQSKAMIHFTLVPRSSRLASDVPRPRLARCDSLFIASALERITIQYIFFRLVVWGAQKIFTL